MRKTFQDVGFRELIEKIQYFSPIKVSNVAKAIVDTYFSNDIEKVEVEEQGQDVFKI